MCWPKLFPSQSSQWELQETYIWFLDTTQTFFYIFTFVFRYRTRPFRKFNVQNFKNQKHQTYCNWTFRGTTNITLIILARKIAILAFIEPLKWLLFWGQKITKNVILRASMVSVMIVILSKLDLQWDWCFWLLEFWKYL